MGFWDGKRPPKEDFATKEDIKKLQKDIERLLKDKDQPDTKGAASRLIKAGAHGFGDIAKSLASSENKRRMKIAQMPGRRAPIAMEMNKPNPLSGKNAGLRRHSISYAPKREG